MNGSALRATAIAVLGCAAIVGCGGQSDEQQIKSLVKNYVADFAAHKGADACKLLTPSAQRRIQATAGILRGPNCGATLTTVSNLPTGDAARQLSKLYAGKVVVDGNEAGVLIEPAAPGAKPTRIVKVNGTWLIDGSVANTR